MNAIYYERVVEDLIASKMDNFIKEFLDCKFEEKVKCMIDETVENYDFSDYLDDWVDDYLNERVKNRIEVVIEDKIKEYLGSVSPEDYNDEY